MLQTMMGHYVEPEADAAPAEPAGHQGEAKAKGKVILDDTVCTEHFFLGPDPETEEEDPSQEIDLCGSGKQPTLPDYARSVNRESPAGSKYDIYRYAARAHLCTPDLACFFAAR